VEKAEAAIRLAKTDIGVPYVEAFARYSHLENVPFLAHNCGTFGVHFSYDLFDGGRKQGIPPNNRALHITLRSPTYMEPTVYAAGAAKTMVNVVRKSLFD